MFPASVCAFPVAVLQSCLCRCQQQQQQKQQQKKRCSQQHSEVLFSHAESKRICRRTVQSSRRSLSESERECTSARTAADSAVVQWKSAPLFRRNWGTTTLTHQQQTVHRCRCSRRTVYGDTPSRIGANRLRQYCGNVCRFHFLYTVTSCQFRQAHCLRFLYVLIEMRQFFPSFFFSALQDKEQEMKQKSNNNI